MTLERVLLSSPTLLASLQLSATDGDTKSWIQLARTGSFVSKRYGKFDITKTDLSQMVHNFREVTPKTPTELPIDYDHLSMDPKKPGDGIAAGWMKNIELRQEGEELWGEIEWTRPAVTRIQNKEYRFISPSFVKDHTHKDGKKIGTTLLAAAVTNHPFLEGMSALALCSAGEIPFMNFSNAETLDVSAHEALNLSTEDGTKAGMRVMIAPGNARTQDEIGATFEIAEVVGEGDDAFVSVKDANGMIHKWFRATELLPASATPANPQHPGLTPGAAPTVPVPGLPGPGVPGIPGAPGVVPPQAPIAALPGQQGVAPPAPNTAAVVNPTNPNTPVTDPAAPVTPQVPNPVGAKLEQKAAGSQEKDGADGKDGNPFAKGDGDKKPDVTAKVDKGADGEATVVTKSGTDGDESKVAAVVNNLPLPDELKQAIAAALAAAAANPQQKGQMHMKFMLKNDSGAEVEVSLEQLEAAGVKIVKEGETAIPKTELTDLQTKVVSLSSRLDQTEKDKAAQAMVVELNRLSQGAFITKPERDWAEKMWKDTVDLSGFKEWAATKTTAVLSLNKEHGSGGKAEGDAKTNGEQAEERLIDLSKKIAKDEGISLRDATIKAGMQLSNDSEAYRERFASADA
jgi:phage I-like protein